MKTILIPTYYYKPCTFTPVNRISSWVEYLAKNNFKVIVITRYWHAEKNEYERINDKIKIEKNGNIEIHYLPYNSNLRLSIKNNFIRKIFTLFEIFIQNISSSVLAYKNIISYSKKIIKSQQPDLILISGNPFQLFKIGHWAKIKFNINWIADYRDGWTTGNFEDPNSSILNRLILKYNSWFELKWLKNVLCFTTVSDLLVNKIESKIKKQGYLIYNGFTGDVSHETNEYFSNNKKINIVFAGELYALQDYVGFINVVKKIIAKYGEEAIHVLFLGTKNSNHKLPESLYIGYEKTIEVTPRIPRIEALSVLESADAFLMLNYGGMKGIPSSKIFDYLKSSKKIILYKSDKDILDHLCRNSNLGLIADNEDDLYKIISNLIEDKQKNGFIKVEPNIEFIQQFSRENQAKNLLKIINQNN